MAQRNTLDQALKKHTVLVRRILCWFEHFLSELLPVQHFVNRQTKFQFKKKKKKKLPN